MVRLIVLGLFATFFLIVGEPVLCLIACALAGTWLIVLWRREGRAS